MVNPFVLRASILHGTLLGPSRTPPLTVRTAGEPGAYAVAFARDPAADGADGGPVGIRVTVEVAVGRIGIGCLDRAESAFLDEGWADAGPGPQIVDLVADTLVGSGPLIVRNASPAGASMVTVLDVRSVPVQVRDDWPTALSRPQVTPGWARYYGTQGTNLDEKARWRRFVGLDAPLTIAWSDGLRFRVAPRDQLSRVVFMSGTYEPNTLRVLRTMLSPGDVFIDAGANAGIVSLAASTWIGPAGRVVAIEPSAREFERLVDHVALNGLDNTMAIRAAVAAHAGRRTLRIAAAPRAGLNTLGDEFAIAGVETARLEEVEATTIDEIVARERLPTVQAIKLDVEGAEVDALAGAASVLRTHRPALVIEVCATALRAGGASVPQLDARLSEAGYSFFEIDDATGALQPVAGLSAAPDRNVVALPSERAEALLEAAAPRES